MGEEENNLIKFKGIIKTSRFTSENFKIYTISINKKIYPKVKTNKNNDIVIVGNIPSLIIGMEYEIKAKIEINKKFGIQYLVKDIRQDKPTNIDSSRKFLSEIITDKQTNVLLEEYPDIIDKVIRNNLDDIDLSKLNGIGEFTFNKIKTKIIENFCLIDLVDKFGGYIELSIIKKLYDKYTSVKIVEKQLKKDPYKCLCKLSRIGFKTADGILLNLENYGKKENNIPFFKYDLKTSPERMKSCLDYILEENETSGNTRMTIADARRECGKLVPQCIQLFVKIIKDNENIHIDNETKTISTRIAYETEMYIAEKIFYMLKNYNQQWNIPYEIYREDKDIILTNEQLNTLKEVCQNNVSILTAPAGAGKSQSVKMVVNMLEDNDKTYLLATPTGKSSEVLATYVDRDAGTIHRQLKYNPSEDPAWGFNENNKLKVDTVIIDEFGMTDIYLMKHLLNAIDFENTKLLLVFDSYQLSSVGCGNIAHDLLTSKIIPTTFLTKIFRYNEGGLMQIVTKIRNGEQFLPDDFKEVKIFGQKKDYIYLERPQNMIISEILKIYAKLLKDNFSINDIMVLSAYNKGEYGTKNINNYIQQLMQKNEGNKYMQRGDTKFYKGDKIIQIKNNYKAINVYEKVASVYNGNTGVVIDVGWNEMIVDFGKEQIIYTKENLDEIELGYCISIHKAQGDNSKNIILISPKAHTFMLNSNLLYVGGTRAKLRVFHIGNIRTINKALKKKENLQRNTFLKDLLIDLNKNTITI
ncbi:AAA family ATPase [Clostridium botulinum]